MSGYGLKILYVGNDVDFFLSHRLGLARAARDAGYQVHVAAPEGANQSRVWAEGFQFHPYPLSRAGLNPWGELKAFWVLRGIIRQVRPHLMHTVSLKPVVYGGLLARVLRVPTVVHALTGMGFLFTHQGLKVATIRLFVTQIFRFIFSHPNGRVVFQNPEDLQTLVEQGVVKKEQTVLIRGSGVDPSVYPLLPFPPLPVTVVLASRMLRDKGVYEFVAVAQNLKAKGSSARFVLVGDTDVNPASIQKAQLEAWARAGIVEWWGHRKDMVQVFAQAHVVCLPSYREGLPKVLIEAASCGRPLVATDIPGCREMVHHGKNGLLVEVKDIDTLEKALETLIEDAPLRQRMGEQGRKRVENEFALSIVTQALLGVYAQLLQKVERKP